jgi:hypothetical protein
MRVKLFLAIGFVVTVVISILIGQVVFLLERSFPSDYLIDAQMPSADDLIAGTDKPGGLMFSLTLGLFVLVGFALRGLGRPRLFSRFVIVTAGAFLAASTFAIYMGFLARMVALYYVSFPQAPSIGLIGTFLILQAIGVAASGLAAILLLLDLLSMGGEGANSSPPVAAAPPPADARSPRKPRKATPGRAG